MYHVKMSRLASRLESASTIALCELVGQDVWSSWWPPRPLARSLTELSGHNATQTNLLALAGVVEYEQSLRGSDTSWGRQRQISCCSEFAIPCRSERCARPNRGRAATSHGDFGAFVQRRPATGCESDFLTNWSRQPSPIRGPGRLRPRRRCKPGRRLLNACYCRGK